MIIWGSKGRDVTIGRGAFFCPLCKSEAHYSHQRVSRYFTLYFIPLFPTNTLGEYLRCGTCNGQLRPEVRMLSREQIEQATAPWTCVACGNRNSPGERACLSCKAPRTAAAPPPLPQAPTASLPAPEPDRDPPADY